MTGAGGDTETDQFERVFEQEGIYTPPPTARQYLRVPGRISLDSATHSEQTTSARGLASVQAGSMF